MQQRTVVITTRRMEICLRCCNKDGGCSNKKEDGSGAVFSKYWKQTTKAKREQKSRPERK